MSFHHISDLRPNVTDKWQINVMVSRVWTVYNPNTNRRLSFDAILSDERGSSIHAKTPTDLIDTFKDSLLEGHVYRINRFVVRMYQTMYRPLKCDIFVLFSRATTLHPSLMQPCHFNRHVFEFLPFNQLRERMLLVFSMSGVVLRIKAGVVQSSNKDVRSIFICDDDARNSGVRVSVWGNLSRKFSDAEIQRLHHENIVVIVTCCKVRLFQGDTTLMTTSASDLYLNLELPMVECFKNFQYRPAIIKQPDEVDQQCRVTTIPEMLSILNEGCVEGRMFTIDGNVVHVDLSLEWNYIACNICRKQTKFIDDRYFCPACKKNVLNPTKSYKLVIHVKDCDKEIQCVLFDDAAISLLGINAEDLILKSSCEVACAKEWLVDFFIDNLLARRVILRIKIDRLNLSPSCSPRFTVSKYLGDDPSCLNKQRREYKGGSLTAATTIANGVTESVDDSDATMSTITQDEIDMMNEIQWGLRMNSVTCATSLAPVLLDNTEVGQSAHEVVQPSDVVVPAQPAPSRADETVEGGNLCHHSRPKRNVKKPRRLRD